MLLTSTILWKQALVRMAVRASHGRLGLVTKRKQELSQAPALTLTRDRKPDAKFRFPHHQEQIFDFGRDGSPLTLRIAGSPMLDSEYGTHGRSWDLLVALLEEATE